MAKNWKKDRAMDRIDASIAALPLSKIEIREYVRDTSLHDLPQHVAYRVNGVHLYADILNLRDMLNITNTEGETCHKKVLRFLNLHYRAVHRILDRVDAMRVDFHNQRLHAIVAKPYDVEADRIRRAIAIGQLIIDVLARTGEDEEHPNAKVRIGIDSGKALAVNNGRRGHREPLFLGEPANHAAKRASGGTVVGIYLTNKARAAIGLAQVKDENATALTAEEIAKSKEKAQLGVAADEIVKEWKEDLEKNPIGAFTFSGHTPPFKDLDIEALSAKNSRRNDAATVYADLDGFTKYVAANIEADNSAKHVVRTLHVLRGELDAVLHTDFEGRKVRFIGDCVHGLNADGTAQTTEVEDTISNMTLCAGAMRSSFTLAIDRLSANGTDAKSLGLAIGFEFGPMTVTRLGMKGDLVRCSVSRGVLTAEEEQQNCSGMETAIGSKAYGSGSAAVRKLFGSSRKVAHLTYDATVEALDAGGDKAARVVKREALAAIAPTVHVSPGQEFRPHCSKK
jgi:class 3 adenylate cyclase